MPTNSSKNNFPIKILFTEQKIFVQYQINIVDKYKLIF